MAFFVFFAEAAGLRDQINEGFPLTTFAQDSRAGRRTSPAIQRRREMSGAASILPCPFADQLRPPTGSLSVRYLSCKGEYTTHMAEKLKIIPLGGLNEIGKNMTAYEYGGEIIVVDCGMAFPGDDMYGIDCVIPDVTYLIKNRSRLRGLFITHGHEDHIGAIPYVLKQVNMPIYCTRFTAGLIKLKLQEHRLLDSTKLVTVEAGQTVKAGKFQVEFIHVNHSIADSVAFAIHTRMGVVVHTGDFKIDSTPIDGEVIDLARFGALGKEGVLALLADSTNVERPGYTMSERMVGKTFQRQFTGCKQRIIVTTFASNVHRIQQIIDAAAACGRKVAVTGRSMENIMKVSTVIFLMLLVPYCKLSLGELRIAPLHVRLLLVQIAGGLGLYLALAPIDPLLAQGTFICVLAPTATSAAVVTGMLGGSVASLATYCLLSNMVVALISPVVFSFVGSQVSLPLLDSLLRIGRQMIPLLILPFVAALALQRFWPRAYRALRQRQSISFYLWA